MSETAAAVRATDSDQPHHLKRVLRLRDLVAYGIICITPVAPLPLFGITQQLSNGHAVVPILIAMVAMSLTAVSYGRMAAAFPQAGSAYTYVGNSLHPKLGTLTGWLMCLDYGLIPLINVLYGALTLHQLIPSVPFFAWAVLIAVLTTVLNLRGITTTSRASELLLVGMSVVLAGFFVLAVKHLLGGGAGALLSTEPFYNPGNFHLGAIATATSFAALTYIGFDAVTTLSEDAKNPVRDVPLATVLTCIFTGIVGGIAVYLGQLVVPHPGVFRNIETAFMDVTRVVGGDTLYQAMGIVFLVAAFGSALTAQAGAGRLLYAMAKQNVMPKTWFSRIDERGRVPAANVIVVGCIALAGALILSFEHAAELLNYGAFLGFMGVNAASFRTFWLAADRSRRSLLRDAAVPVLGFVFCLGIFVSLPRPALVAGTAWLILGIAFTAWRSRSVTP